MPPYLPALVIGLIVGAYWSRVIKLVLKQRRRTGRDANFVPREKLGLYLRFIWYPLVVLWVVLPFVVAWKPALPQPLTLPGIPEWLAWTGVAIAVGAFTLTLICWKKMGKSWRMGIDPAEKTSLIVTGPYAWVRHPIYALSCVLMLASAAAVPVAAMWVIAVLHIFFLQWEARREEQYLLSVQGDAYGDYMRKVGRFLPRFI